MSTVVIRTQPNLFESGNRTKTGEKTGEETGETSGEKRTSFFGGLVDAGGDVIGEPVSVAYPPGPGYGYFLIQIRLA